MAAGTDGYQGEPLRRLRVLNLFSYLIAFVTLIYAAQHSGLDQALYGPVILINLMLVVVALLVPFMHRFHEVAGGLWLVGAEYAAMFALTFYLGRDSGIQLQYLIGAAAPFVILGLKRLWLVGIIVVLGLALHLLAWFLFPPGNAVIPPDAGIINPLYVNATLSTGLLISATVYYAFYLADKAREEVDRLLLNILPPAIIERLKADPDEAIADRIEDASVMFLDLEGFTALAARIGPAQTVEFLSRLFNELDQLAQKNGVEKIKTIGDAYMVASGIPEEDPDHLTKLARMALGARECVGSASKDLDIEINCRIGLASGCVMAGVIGTKKFSYDVWGQTVNLASRMESHADVGCVQVPLDVKVALDEHFEFASAGRKQIKGEGAVDCWYLLGEKV